VLSPPIVSDGHDVVPIGMRSIGQVAFTCFSQPLMIAVVERIATNRGQDPGDGP